MRLALRAGASRCSQAAEDGRGQLRFNLRQLQKGGKQGADPSGRCLQRAGGCQGVGRLRVAGSLGGVVELVF